MNFARTRCDMKKLTSMLYPMVYGKHNTQELQKSVSLF